MVHVLVKVGGWAIYTNGLFLLFTKNEKNTSDFFRFRNEKIQIVSLNSSDALYVGELTHAALRVCAKVEYRPSCTTDGYLSRSATPVLTNFAMLFCADFFMHY